MALVALVGCTSSQDVLDKAIGDVPDVNWPPPPSTLLKASGGTTMRLIVGGSDMPCPPEQRGYSVMWDIGDAVPDTGRLSHTGRPASSVADQGKNLWCDTVEPHSWTLTAEGPNGPASRTVTF
jgi:hypothetical protein